MTVKTVDTGSIPYSQFDAYGNPTGDVFYRSQNGGNTVRYQKVAVPKHKVFYKGKWLTFPKKTLRTSLPKPKPSEMVTDYTVVAASMYNVPIVGSGPYGPNTAQDYWYPVPQGANQPDWDSNDDLKLLEKLREKLLGSDFNAGIFLAEGHQTLSMVGDVAIRILKGYRHLARGDLAGCARSLFEGTSRAPLIPYAKMKPFDASKRRLISGHWLELQYGWLPLLKDVHAGAEMLAHKLHWPLEKKTTASRTTRSIKKYNIYDGYFPGKDPLFPHFGHVVNYACLKKKVISVYHRETGPNIWASLGLTDPASVLWEKLPWSFVADWLIPFGSWLSARGLADMFAGNTVVTSQLIRQEWYEVQGVQWTPAGGTFADAFPTSWVGWNQRARKRTMSYSRIKSTNLDVPPPSFKSLSKAASWQHATNAVALLTQQFAGRR